MRSYARVLYAQCTPSERAGFATENTNSVRFGSMAGRSLSWGTTGSSTVVRDDCSIPSSKALLFPILNTECTSIEEFLRCDDGTPIQIDGTFRVGSPDKPSFCVFLAPDDLLSFVGEGPGGFSGTHFHPGFSCGTVDDGYYLMLAPMSEGPHTVHFHGESPASTFTLDVTYPSRCDKKIRLQLNHDLKAQRARRCRPP